MFGQSNCLKDELKILEPKTRKTQAELPKVNLKEHIEGFEIHIQILTEQLQQKTNELQELKAQHVLTLSSVIVDHKEQKEELLNKCARYEEVLLKIESLLNLSTEKQKEKDLLTRVSQFCERVAVKSQGERGSGRNSVTFGEKNFEADNLTSTESRKNEVCSNSIQSNDEVEKEGCSQKRESEQMASQRKKRYISANPQANGNNGYREQPYERKRYYGK